MTICAGTPIGKIEIDLKGPKGNASILLSTARQLAKPLQLSSEQTQNILHEMMADDYKHLVDTFEHYFGLYVDIYGYDEIFRNE